MGSGILLTVLVVLWIVVLVPMVLRRGPAEPVAEGTVSTMRILHRRGSDADRPETAMDILKRPLRDPRVGADVVRRRRRTLAGLVGLAVVWALLALFVASWLWTAQIVLDLIVFGYVVFLRLEAQREAERKERRAVRFADRSTATRSMPGTSRPSTRTGSSRPGVPPIPPPTRRVPSFSDAEVTGPIRRVTPDGPPATRTGWTPNPVPVPTYVNKATAPTRDHRIDEGLVGLDDDDPSFAAFDEWHGKRAVGD